MQEAPSAPYAINFAIMFAYNGSDFDGLERSKGLKSIEAIILSTVAEVVGKATDPSLHISMMNISRASITEKGEHASRQILSLEISGSPDFKVPDAQELNEKLPKGIHIFKVLEMSQGFSARRSCETRTFEFVFPSYVFAPPPEGTMYSNTQEEDGDDFVYPSDMVVEAPVGGMFKTLVRPKQEATGGKDSSNQAGSKSSPSVAVHEKPRRRGFSHFISKLLFGKKVPEQIRKDEEMEKVKEKGSTLSRKSLHRKDAPQIPLEVPKKKGESDDTQKLLSVEEDHAFHGMSGFFTTFKRTMSTKRRKASFKDDQSSEVTAVEEVKLFDPLDIPWDEAYLTKLTSYRINELQLNSLKKIISLYYGTHNWHNYIPGASADDSRCYLRILNIELASPQIHQGLEWIRIKVQAKAFARFQIRKMIALAIMVIRTNTPISVIGNSFGYAKIDIPEVPASGLILDEPHYSEFNDYAARSNNSTIDFDGIKDKVEQFRKSEIHEKIYEHEKKEMEFAQWIRNMDMHSFLYTYFLNHRGVIDRKNMNAELTDLGGVLTAFGFQIAICSGVLIAFSFLRPWLKSVYEPRIIFASDEAKKPLKLGIKPLAWIWPTFYISELDMIDQIGMDSVIFLRFIATCFKFFAGSLVVAVPLLIFNYYSPKITRESGVDANSAPNDASIPQVIRASLRYLTMENLEANSKYYYVYSFATLAVSVYAYVLFYWTWLDYISLRKQYVQSRDYIEAPHCRTLLLSGLPPKFLEKREVEKFILSIYPEAEIDQIVYGRDFKELTQLCGKHLKTNRQLEYALDKFFGGKPRPTNNSMGLIGTITFSGKQEDSIRKYGRKLNDLEEKIYELRSKGDEAFNCRFNAFVSFSRFQNVQKILRKVYMPTTIDQIRITRKAKVRECPPFDDLIWENLGLGAREKLLRRLITWTSTAFLTLGWTAVIAFISGLSDLEKIAKISPKLAGSISSSKGAIIVLESIIAPGLIVAAFSLLQLFLYYTSLFQGIGSRNGVAKSILRKFYVFQIYQFFLFITLSSTWEYFREPELLRDLRRSVVRGFLNNSTFYINYTIVNYIIYCLELLQAYRLLVNWLYPKIFNLTPRDWYNLRIAPELNLSNVACSLLVIFYFCCAYVVVAPLIVPFATIFFGIVYIVFKYQQFYVNETRRETGGSWWPQIFNLLCFSIAFFQLMTGGSIFILSASISTTGNGKAQAFIVFINILITFCYWVYMNAKFRITPLVVESSTPSDTKFNLDHLISDPAMGDPLNKVWIRDEFKEKLSIEYEPKYSSAVDFMKTKGIDNSSHVERLTQRSKIYGIRHRRDTPAGTSLPPEILLSLQE